jgi:DNA-binding winged helix-turn-helix (wHTH) protein
MMRFGSHTLDPRNRILRRGPQLVPLEPLVLNLLLYLVAHRDRAIARQELVEAVWSGAKLERSAVSGAVKKLRRALAQDARCVETVRRYGFRFAAEVREEERVVEVPRMALPGPAAADRMLTLDVILPRASACELALEASLERDLDALLRDDVRLRLHEYRVLGASADERPQGIAAPESGRVEGPRYILRGTLSPSATGFRLAAVLIAAVGAHVG